MQAKKCFLLVPQIFTSKFKLEKKLIILLQYIKVRSCRSPGNNFLWREFFGCDFYWDDFGATSLYSLYRLAYIGWLLRNHLNNFLWNFFKYKFHTNSISKCMTKMENFAGSRKVAHILEVWALLSTKIPISSRSVENSSVMSHSPAAPPVFANPAQLFFSKL